MQLSMAWHDALEIFSHAFPGISFLHRQPSDHRRKKRRVSRATVIHSCVIVMQLSSAYQCGSKAPSRTSKVCASRRCRVRVCAGIGEDFKKALDSLAFENWAPRSSRAWRLPPQPQQQSESWPFLVHFMGGEECDQSRPIWISSGLMCLDDLSLRSLHASLDKPQERSLQALPPRRLRVP